MYFMIGAGLMGVGGAVAHNWYGRKQQQREGGMPARKSVEPGKKLGDPQYQIDPKDNRQFPSGTLVADYKNMKFDSLSRSVDDLYKGGVSPPPKTVHVPESKDQFFVKGGRVYLPTSRERFENDDIREIKYRAQYQTHDALKRGENIVTPDVIESRTSLSGGPSPVFRHSKNVARPSEAQSWERRYEQMPALRRQPPGRNDLFSNAHQAEPSRSMQDERWI